MAKYGSLAERIIANSIMSDTSIYDNTPCWEWIGAVRTNRTGMHYPSMTVWSKRKKKTVTVAVHRVVLREIKGRSLPAGAVARHLCNNSLCVNPEHLKGGTQRTNCKDTVKAGRHRNGALGPLTPRTA